MVIRDTEQAVGMLETYRTNRMCVICNSQGDHMTKHRAQKKVVEGGYLFIDNCS